MAQKKLGGRGLQLADYVFPRMAATVPTGTTLADVMAPSYFSAQAAHLKPGAEILLMSDDFVLDVSLRVTTVTKTTVITRVIRDSSIKAEKKRGPKAKSLPDSIKVDHGGENHKWRFQHAGELIEHGFGTEEDAKGAAMKYAETALG